MNRGFVETHGRASLRGSGVARCFGAGNAVQLAAWLRAATWFGSSLLISPLFYEPAPDAVQRSGGGPAIGCREVAREAVELNGGELLEAPVNLRKGMRVSFAAAPEGNLIELTEYDPISDYSTDLLQGV